MDKTPGQLINEIITCNIRIWHTATQLKDLSGKLRDDDLSVEDKVVIHTKTRVENAQRSALRYLIDSVVDPDNAVDDRKINYTEKKETSDE